MRIESIRPRSLFAAALLASAAGLSACADDGVEPVATSAAAVTSPPGCLHPTWCPPPSSDWNRDLLDTRLDLDLAGLHGSATITFMPSMTSTGASFDVRGLLVRDVRGPLGPLAHTVADGRLDVGVPLGTVSVTVDYDFTVQDEFDGYLAQGLTFTWPYFCGNLFPCKSETFDGQSYSLNVTGVPEGQVAVYPSVIPGNAPSYMPALATGAYTKLELGTTPAGTHLSVWYLPGEEARAIRGTSRLVAGFHFFEHTLGAYTFGTEAGAVSAPWGPGAVGGMEHHPLWHVGSASMGDALTQLHEAAHGWFGNGVRMKCWEDFVLSEGSANYWAVRAVEAVYGEPSNSNVWAFYQRQLDFILASGGDTIAWPQGCNKIDLLHHPLWSSVPYVKGAFFLRAVEERVGRAAFDQAMAVFYMWNVGKAASMQDLIDTVEGLTGKQLDDLAQVWLRQLGAP